MKGGGIIFDIAEIAAGYFAYKNSKSFGGFLFQFLKYSFMIFMSFVLLGVVILIPVVIAAKLSSKGTSPPMSLKGTDDTLATVSS